MSPEITSLLIFLAIGLVAGWLAGLVLGGGGLVLAGRRSQHYALTIPKPMIAMVQGACIAGGLMLAWVCDMIVASDDAFFQDPVVRMGVPGVEYFAHPWELGPRKAKELLFTADWLSAQEARALGMVNHVVPAAELAAFTLALALPQVDEAWLEPFAQGLLKPGPAAPYSELSASLGWLLLGSVLTQLLAYS